MDDETAKQPGEGSAAVEPAATALPTEVVEAAVLHSEQAKSLKRKRRARRIAAAVLIFLGSVLAPISLLSVWANNTISNTDHYLATVGPLASNAAIQSAVTDKVTNEVVAAIDVPKIVKNALPARAAPIVAPIEGALYSFVHSTVAKVVASSTFQKVWIDANKVTHKQLVALLNGNGKNGITVTNGEVVLDLSPLVTNVQHQLASAGFTVVNRLPVSKVPHTSIVLFKSDSLTKAQAGFQALNTLGVWLPVVALVFLIAGVLLSLRRRAALVRPALYVAFGMVLVLIVMKVVRHFYLASVPADVLPRPAAAAAFDIAIHFLIEGARAMLAFALLIALGAYFTGPARLATAARTGVNRGLSAVGSWLEQAGALPVGLRQWVLRYRPWLQGVVVLAFVVATLLWSPHTAKVEIWLAIIGVVLLAIIGIVRSRTREELADLVERRERAAAAREEEQQAAVAAAALNEPVAAGSIGPAPDEDPTKGTA